MAYMNIETSRKVMKRHQIDAIVATSAADFCYTSGYHLKGGFLPGASIIPADLALEPIIVVSQYEERMARNKSHFKDIRTYSSWVELVDIKNITDGKQTRVPKPSYFDDKILCDLLSEALKEKKLHGGTIGVRMDSMTHRVYSLLSEKNPKARFVDAGIILDEIQKVKTRDGIEALRMAASIGAKGIEGMIDERVMGATVSELQLRYRKSVIQQITRDNVMQFTFGRGNSVIVGDPFVSLESATHKVSPGDSVFIDCGVLINGHQSDMGRHFVAGKPSPLQTKIYRALLKGYEAGLLMMKPKVKLKEIYNVVHDTIRGNGLDWYTRGHVGHSVGMYPPGEQPPYICPNEETELEPNMVMCLETPLYVNGLGAFIIEDMILITPQGHEVLTLLPRDLVELK